MDFNPEIIGTIAALMVVAGFIVNGEKWIRILSMVACVFWIGYAVIIFAPSMLVMNIAVLIIHSYKLCKMGTKPKEEPVV